MKYARIIKCFAEKGHLTYEDAMDKFYNSETYTLISEGVADMHCMSDEYLADELLIEFGMMDAPGSDLAQKVEDGMDELWDKGLWDQEANEAVLKEHLRTPYRD